MKKVQLDEISYLHFDFEFDRKCRQNFCRFFRNAFRIIFVFFEIVSKPIFDENLSSSLFDFWTLRFWETAIPLLFEKCQVQFAFAVTGNVFAVFFSITFCSGREVKGLFENDSKRSSKSSKCRQRRRRRRRSSKKVTLSSFFPGFTSLSNFFVGSS